MADSNELYDLVVIGGGITGAGIARDAVLRGLRVALFEKGDYGSGTSSKSSKMIHGGLRYLEQYEFGLVFESLSERSVQCRVAPHLVRPVKFFVPIFKENKPGLEIVNLGLWLYDTMSMFRAPEAHKTYRGAKAAAMVPLLRKSHLRGAIEYYDCVTDDARLVLENIIDAKNHGADCFSYTEVIELERSRGRVNAVTVRDCFTGETRHVRCRAAIIAAGAWTDEFIDQVGLDVGQKLLRRTKGVHLVFRHEKLPLKRSVTLIAPDGRVMFAIPWRGRTVVGTTDTDFEGTADRVHADASDAAYLCEAANAYFPEVDLQPSDVIGTWAGLRPLIAEPNVEDESDVSREHRIFARDDGTVIIAGGKLTTYRRMAKEVVKTAIAWLRHNDKTFTKDLHRPRTKKRPLPGAAGLVNGSVESVNALAQELTRRYELDPTTGQHLCNVYGVRAHKLAESISADRSLGERMDPELPHVWAEVPFAVRDDLAKTVDDVLSRRIPLLLVGSDQGLDVLDRVVSIMAQICEWTEERKNSEVERYRRVVADSRLFREQ